MNKEGFGAIFRNKDKKTEKSPDYTGSITLNGQEIKLSCWLATSQNGMKYFQVRVNTNTQGEKREQKHDNPHDDFINDDVPW